MHAHIYEMSFFVDFFLNKNGRTREKTTTREKHPGRVTQGHKLAALMKKRIEEILHDKEQSSVQPAVQSTEHYSVQSTEQSTKQPSVQSNGAYIYDVGILTALVIGVCVVFAYNTSQAANKKQVNEKQPPKRRHML